MNEVKQPKKQLITYMLIVIVVMILLNSLVMPSLQRAQITETDYNTFITMTEKEQIREVEISSTQKNLSTPPARSTSFALTETVGANDAGSTGVWTGSPVSAGWATSLGWASSVRVSVCAGDSEGDAPGAGPPHATHPKSTARSAARTPAVRRLAYRPISPPDR